MCGVRHSAPNCLLAWQMAKSVPGVVVQYYTQYSTGSYAERLEENEIDIEAMALCSDSDFAEMGIPTGPRLKCVVHSRLLFPMYVSLLRARVRVDLTESCTT